MPRPEHELIGQPANDNGHEGTIKSTERFGDQVQATFTDGHKMDVTDFVTKD